MYDLLVLSCWGGNDLDQQVLGVIYKPLYCCLSILRESTSEPHLCKLTYKTTSPVTQLDLQHLHVLPDNHLTAFNHTIVF